MYYGRQKSGLLAWCVQQRRRQRQIPKLFEGGGAIEPIIVASNGGAVGWMGEWWLCLWTRYGRALSLANFLPAHRLIG